MLKNTFFYIDKTEQTEGSINHSIRLEPKHEIYKGHFPGQPVVPGVVSMQIIKELAEEDLKVKLRLLRAANIKFLIPLTPNNCPEFTAELNYTRPSLELVKLKARLYAGDSQYMKLQAEYLVR